MKRIFCLTLFLFCVVFSLSQAVMAASDNSDNSATTTDTAPQINLDQLLQENLSGQTATAPNRSKLKPAATPAQTVKSYQGQAPASSRSISAVDPEKYRVEPGDTLGIEMWTPVHMKMSGVVSPLGTLNIDPIGEVRVRGIVVKDLPSALEKTLKRYYRSVKVNANLTDVRSVQVQILGEVKMPGAYELPGVTGVLDAIGDAGGLTDKASVRRIQVMMADGKPAGTFDYFKWRIFGDESQNPYIEPNEVIFVSVIKNQVTIDGEVERPGTYETLPGETDDQVLAMAGGYTPDAVPSEVKISRKLGDTARINIPAGKNVVMQNGDSLFVPPGSLFEKKIKVIGEVAGAGIFKPSESHVTGAPELERVGWYRLHDNERVRDVILNLGGLTPSADPSHVRIERKTDHGLQTIHIDLHKLFAENDQSQNVALQDGDTLVVPNAPDSVFVLGEVTKPGVLPYTPGNQIREYLTLAGGPASHANLKHAKLIRNVEGSSNPQVYNINLNDILIGGKTPKDLLVEPGDVIYVPRSAVTSLADILNYVSAYAIFKALVP